MPYGQTQNVSLKIFTSFIGPALTYGRIHYVRYALGTKFYQVLIAGHSVVTPSGFFHKMSHFQKLAKFLYRKHFYI